ncbi:MAG: cellulase [Clostridium sp.]|nr:cellulase [Clostridium sp.]
MIKKRLLCLVLSAATMGATIVAPIGTDQREPKAATKIVSKGDLIQNNDFAGGKGLPWTVVETYPATSEFDINDGSYDINVTNINGRDKDNRWAVQFRHRGLTLVQGHTYKVSFTVKAEQDCKIYPKIGRQGGDYKEFWNNNWEPYTLRAGETKTITSQFTMNDRTENQIEFAFHLAGDCAASKLPYKFTFTNISVKDPQFKGYEKDYDENGYAIRVNQVGYFTNSEKKATISTTANKPIEWKLVNSSNKTVKSGMSTVIGNDEASGDNVHQIDFSDYNVKGTGYKLVIDDKYVVPEHNDDVDEDLNVKGESTPFDIGDNLYSQMKYDAIKYFYHNRSGIDIESKYTDGRSDLARKAGHKPDIMPCAKDTWYKENYSLDITGGWYDAGDHGKYVVNGGISTWTMQNQYERALNAGEDVKAMPYGDGTMNIPESGNGNPDILDESRWNVEALLKMQVPDGKELAGMVHHKAHDERWTALGIKPEDDPMDRYLQPPSTAATLNLAAIASQASRLWEKYDSTFADKCLASAKKAWKAALAHPDIFAPLKGGVGGGAYGDNRVEDEFYWAAAELYATTGDSEYLDFMKKSPCYLAMPSSLTGGEDTGVSGCFDWGNVEGLGTLSLLASKNKLPESEIAKAKANVTKAADVFVENTNKEGYGTSITTSQFEKYKGYPWGSNSFVTNSMILLSYANDINKATTPKYLNAANRAMDYILGENANNQSYVTGYGTKSLQNPHHRFWSYQADNEFPKAPSGVISGGPNSGLEDPWVKGSGWRPGQKPAAKCFMDNIESWSTNECTINWNAPFAWITSYLDDHNNPIPIDPIIYGDVDGDKKVNVKDLLAIKQFVAGVDVKINSRNADVNGDGKVDLFDTILIQQYLKRVITKFPAEK